MGAGGLLNIFHSSKKRQELVGNSRSQVRQQVHKTLLLSYGNSDRHSLVPLTQGVLDLHRPGRGIFPHSYTSSTLTFPALLCGWSALQIQGPALRIFLRSLSIHQNPSKYCSGSLQVGDLCSCLFRRSFDLGNVSKPGSREDYCYYELSSVLRIHGEFKQELPHFLTNGTPWGSH